VRRKKKARKKERKKDRKETAANSLVRGK